MTETKTTTAPKTEAPRGRGGDRRPGGRGGRRPGGKRPPRPKPDYEQKILTIRRVTRVMAGGGRFSFSVTLVIGNKNGVVGVGVGKANDTSLAIQKAYNNAQRNLVQLNLNENKSIDHDVQAKYSSATVKLMPNTARGLVAGSGVRAVLELGGVTDITAKILTRSKNQLNIARAAIKALAPFSLPFVAKKKPAKAADSSSEKSAAPAKS